jgi:DNA-binding SARP family transcriptional activator
MVTVGSGDVQVLLLGPVVVSRGGVEVGAGSARQVAVLMVLAGRAGRVVGLSELVAGVWGDQAPASAEGNIYTYISALRKILEPVRGTRVAPVVLTGDRAGYRLRLSGDGTDMAVVQRLWVQARELAGRDPGGAAELVGQALGLWRGEALAGVPGPFAEAERARLGELVWLLREAQAEWSLAAGRQEELLPELMKWVAAQPLRERLVGVLLTALFRAGRQADAIMAYQQTRAVLRDELGVDPASELTGLYQQILLSDPALLGEGAARGPGPGPGPELVVPAQLPHDATGFVGRELELATLHELLADAAEPAGARAPLPVVISTIEGYAGVGKTALAVKFAHQVASEFPDGQLHLDLRGFDPALPPLTDVEALTRLLSGLGAEVQQLPEEVESLAGMYRSRLAGRRVLVVLDNAVSSEQVRRLLPGTAGCVALITSRNRLAGLVVRHGARRLSLGLLPDRDAHALLAGLLGAARVEFEPGPTAELIGLCGGLPLALRIVAERLTSRPANALADVVGELRVEQNRLDLLAVPGDPSVAVRAVLSWSYQALTPEQARLFRLLPVQPGPDLSLAAAAALAGLAEPVTRQLLRQLSAGHLVDELPGHRYRQHDLLRLYALEQLEQTETPEQRREAFSRLAAFYLHTTASARQAQPSMVAVELAAPPPDVAPLVFPDAAAGLDWMAAEQVNLPLIVHAVSQSDLPEATWQLAHHLRVFYRLHSSPTGQMRIAELGLAAATARGDLQGQALMLDLRGLGLAAQGDPQAGLAELQQALALWERLGDPAGMTMASLDTAFVLSEVLGRHGEALEFDLTNLPRLEASGDLNGLARLKAGLGYQYAMCGDYQSSVRLSNEALALTAEVGQPILAFAIRVDIGIAETIAGHLDIALAMFNDLLEHPLGADPLNVIEAITYRGACHRGLGRPLLALQDLSQAIGMTAHVPVYRAKALHELGRTHLILGQPELARQQWRDALTILDPFGHALADTIRSELAELAELEQNVPPAALTPC